MIKEAKKVDFLTTGRQPSQGEFARISEWIRNSKQKKNRKKEETIVGRKRGSKNGILKSEAR